MRETSFRPRGGPSPASAQEKSEAERFKAFVTQQLTGFILRLFHQALMKRLSRTPNRTFSSMARLRRGLPLAKEFLEHASSPAFLK